MATVEQVMKAVKAADEERLRKLLGAPRRVAESLWRPALGPVLIEATRNKSEGCVAALLEAGADPNAKDKLEQSALHWAAFHGAAGCAQLLMRAGADTESTTRNGKTRPIHAALRSGSAAVVEALLSGGAKALDPDGSPSARHRALSQLEVGQAESSQRLTAFATATVALLERAELLELSAERLGPAPKSKSLSL